MKKFAYFALGLLCGAVFLSGTAVAANAEVLARLTSQVFYFDGERHELDAYSIGGENYIRFRDAAELFGLDTETSAEIVETEPHTPPTAIDGTAYGREDFAANASNHIFSEIYTREAYNTMRQTITDTARILADDSVYRYAHYVDHGFTFSTPGKTDTAMKSVAAYISGYYTYSFGAEATIRNLYEFPGYRILKVEVNPRYADANAATEDFIHNLLDLTDREKVKCIADAIADRIIYKDANPAGINEIFTAASPVNGICGTYANAFIYLCQRAGIPCVKVTDATHAWNEVYIDGKWYATDISYYDVARTDASLFPANFTRTDGNAARTAFAKELLVPGSTNN